MKLNKFTFIAILGLAIGSSSCVKDLDVDPIDPNTSSTEKVFSSALGFKQALAKLYGSYALSGQQGPAGNADISGLDEGFGNYIRAYWNLQELTTDEAIMSWGDQTIKDFHWHTWSANDVFNNAVYSRIYYSIAVANEYIRNANTYITKLSAADQAIAKQYIAEARFVRALSYWHAIDLYGNVPFITEKDRPANNFFPKQIKRADLFAYIESELKDIAGDNGDLANPKANEYGHADKGAAWSLLARLYLNAEVYLGKGNKKYTECITYCNKVISSGKYTINPSFQANFNAQNDQSSEMIFAINYDVVNTQTYGGMPFILHASIGGDMTPSKQGMGGGWGGIRTTPDFASKFENINKDYTSPAVGTSPDKRALFFVRVPDADRVDANGNPKKGSDGKVITYTDQTWDINDVGAFTNGWAIVKYTNLNNDGTRPTPFNDFVNTDYPMFRLADVYLMYAEAVVRGGTGGDLSTALQYVNKLRSRAYGDINGTAGNITAGQLTLSFLIDERGRELYWEGIRRTDLIRFKMFTGDAYVWTWKGNVKSGAPTSAYRDLFPIPTQDLVVNPNLIQNEGY